MIDEHQRLVDTLKFTPRNIRISISGYGGEIVMGSISKEAYDHWNQQEEDLLTDFVLDNMEQEQLDRVPESARFVESGCWYECDDIVHESSVEMGTSGFLSVVDLSNNAVLLESASLEPSDLENFDIEVECANEYYASLLPPNAYCFFGQSIEKGLFFEAEFEIRQPFDASKMKLYYNDIEGVSRFSYITYDGEVIDDPGNYDTTGKGMEFTLLSSSD